MGKKKIAGVMIFMILLCLQVLSVDRTIDPDPPISGDFLTIGESTGTFAVNVFFSLIIGFGGFAGFLIIMYIGIKIVGNVI